MSVDLARGIVRLIAPGGRTAGAGFVVDAEGLIVTCAHVVKQSGAHEVGASGPSAVTLVFQATQGQGQTGVDPGSGANGERRTAHVTKWAEPEDVAFLRLDGPLPQGVEALPLGSSNGTRGHAFRTFGYPSAGPSGGMNGYGRIGDPVGEANVVLLQVTEATEVTRGFSGGPVFDLAARRVVGMVTAITRPDADGRLVATAFVTPTEVLRAACPELQLSEVCPYRGLQAFTAGDEEFFHGRDRAVAAVTAALQGGRRLVAVLGPSGSGKSSLVHAGVLPRLRRGALPGLAGSDRWDMVVARPGRDPFAQLREAGLAGGWDSLAQAVDRWQAAHPQCERLVLVVDQFEELLVATRPALRSDFLSQLCELLQASGPVAVMVVMRDDFYGRLAAAGPDLMQFVEQGLVNVPAVLEAHELADIVASPAQAVGLRFEANLAERIVADAIDASGLSGHGGAGGRSTVLPLLEFALTELWERRDDGWLTHEAYEQIGEVTGALSRWCDQAFAALDDRLRPVARRVISDLVNLGDEAEGIPNTRRRRTFSELARTEDEQESVDAVISALTSARLLVTARSEHDGHATVELMHEALLREWSLLQQWLIEDRGFLVWRQALERQANAWIRSSPDGARGRDPDLLLRGRQLAGAEDWLSKRAADLRPELVEFIEHSQRRQRQALERDRRRARILQLLSAALVIMLLVATAAWSRAVRQQRIAASRGLAAQSLATLDGRPDLGLLLSLEAYRLSPTPEARSAVVTALQRSERTIAFLRGDGHPVWDVSYSPDGRMLAWASDDGTVRLWDLERRAPPNPPRHGHDGRAWKANFSPDGRTLVSAGADGSIVLWDAGRLEREGGPLLGHRGEVFTAIFSPDGRVLASAGADRTVRLWDVASRRPLGEPLRGHTERVLSIKFSPDGRLLASTSDDSTVRLWDVAARQPLGGPVTAGGEGVFTVAFSPDGKTLAFGGFDRKVTLWDVTRAAPQGEPLEGHQDAVVSAEFGPDGATLASASGDGNIIVWDVSSPQPLGERRGGHRVALSPDGATLASASGDGTIAFWDLALGHPRASRTDALASRVTSLAFSPRGGLVASGSEDGTIRLWDPGSARAVGAALQRQGGAVLGLAFSPDGATLASAGGDGTVLLWEVTSGRRLGELEAHKDRAWALAFSPDGATLASAGGDGTVRLWEVGKQAAPILLEVLEGHRDEVTAVSFSPDGATLASGSFDRTIRFWDVVDRRSKGEPIEGLSSRVTSLAFSPQGATLASANEHGAVSLWDMPSRRSLGKPLPGHTTWVFSLAFDRATLASASDDSSIVLWDEILWSQDAEAFKDRLCPVAGRNLSPVEWAEFLPGERWHPTCPQLGG